MCNYFGYKLTYSANGKPYLRPAGGAIFAEIGTEMLDEITVNETITSLSNMLDSRFFLSHRSCIVNTEKITMIDWKNGIVYFQNGDTIDYLARNKKKELKEYVRSC